MKCGCLFIVQLINQFESFTETIPPVTTLPLNGSLLQIFSVYGGILSSNVVTVAETFYQPNSTLSDEISISHGFMTNTASVELTANSSNVGIDLVWKSFAG